jgi:hypothetical protein
VPGEVFTEMRLLRYEFHAPLAPVPLLTRSVFERNSWAPLAVKGQYARRNMAKRGALRGAARANSTARDASAIPCRGNQITKEDYIVAYGELPR